MGNILHGQKAMERLIISILVRIAQILGNPNSNSVIPTDTLSLGRGQMGWSNWHEDSFERLGFQKSYSIKFAQQGKNSKQEYESFLYVLLIKVSKLINQIAGLR
jgi:hypothetical protein